jgi:hypothetical protein
MLATVMKISDAADRQDEKQDYDTVRRAIEFLTKKFRDQLLPRPALTRAGSTSFSAAGAA